MKLSRSLRFVGLGASALLVIAPALLAGPPPQAGASAGATTGTIKGQLIWTGAALPEAKILVAKDDPKVKDGICKVGDIVSKAITVDPKTKGIANAIVYLVAPTGDYSAAEKALLAKTPQVVIDQVKCEFVPYVTVVHKDQKLVFKSADPVGHNVRFLAFKNESVNTMLQPNGNLTYKIKEAETRPIEIKCDIHPWMNGYFLISDHPLVAVTKADGTFEITGVPPGVQNLVIWHSDPGYVTSGRAKGEPVTVTAGGVVDAGVFKMNVLKKK